MQKIIILLSALLVLASCNHRPTVEGVPQINYVEFKYKGHDMVEFGDVSSYGYTVLHSPECKKCYQTYE